MGFGTTPAGTLVKEDLRLSIRRLPVAASTSVVKGQVCELDASHYLVPSPVSRTAEVQHFVALADADNSSGANGAISCPLAVPGHYVTVVADGTIRPGRRVVISGDTAGRVIEYVAASHTVDQIVGLYVGKEAGIVTKSGDTPFLETISDSADFPPSNAASGDIVEIVLAD